MRPPPTQGWLGCPRFSGTSPSQPFRTSLWRGKPLLSLTSVLIEITPHNTFPRPDMGTTHYFLPPHYSGHFHAPPQPTPVSQGSCRSSLPPFSFRAQSTSSDHTAADTQFQVFFFLSFLFLTRVFSHRRPLFPARQLPPLKLPVLLPFSGSPATRRTRAIKHLQSIPPSFRFHRADLAPSPALDHNVPPSTGQL